MNKQEALIFVAQERKIPIDLLEPLDGVIGENSSETWIKHKKTLEVFYVIELPDRLHIMN